MRRNGADVRLNDNALTTVPDTLEFMGMDPDTVPDPVRNNLIRLINAYSDYMESTTGRKFKRNRYVERHESVGNQNLVMREYPIVSVESIRDVNGGANLEPSQYDWEQGGDTGVIYMDSGWPMKGYRTGLSNDIRLVSRYLEVIYIAGYILPKDATAKQPATLPGDLQWAVWQLVQQQWNLSSNGANGLSAFSISDVTWTFDKGLDPQVGSILNQYMRFC